MNPCVFFHNQRCCCKFHESFGNSDDHCDTVGSCGFWLCNHHVAIESCGYLCCNLCAVDGSHACGLYCMYLSADKNSDSRHTATDWLDGSYTLLFEFYDSAADWSRSESGWWSALVSSHH